jgi:molybdenum cofactor cytidylyltransferase
MNKTAIIILAAGNSSRLGRPKQLLPYRGSTLLAHVVAEALKTSLQPVIVVTGAYHTEIEASLPDEPVVLVYNAHWETGMGPGIVAGLEKALSIEPHLQTAIVAVCDQPYISAELFQTLVEQHSILGKGLIACSYSETLGTPVLFAQCYFKELSMLTGNAGAKQLLKRYPEDVASIAFPKGSIDIDTEEDFMGLHRG